MSRRSFLLLLGGLAIEAEMWVAIFITRRAKTAFSRLGSWKGVANGRKYSSEELLIVRNSFIL